MKNAIFMMAGLALLSSAAQAASTVKIYPYSGAKFLAGQKFDLRIEVEGIQGADSYTVTLDGKPVNGLVRSSSGAGKTEWMLRDFMFMTKGDHTLSVSVTDGSGTKTQTATWNAVVNARVGKQAKNIIVFWGDGMGWNTLQAAEIIGKGYNPVNGQPLGRLNINTKVDGMASVTTSSYDSVMADSANTASSFMTGQKVLVNALNVSPDNTPETLDNPRFETLAEMLNRTRGMGIGIVSTTYGTDASPASVTTHTRRRGDSAAIADQYFTGAAKPDVMLFGGSYDFIPQTSPGSRRKDNKNWIDESQKLGFSFVDSRTSLLAANTNKLFGLFNLDNMPSYLDRAQYKDPKMIGSFTDMPYLWDMTNKAIETLSKNSNGFILFVEAGMIDKYEHPLDWQRGLWDVLELDKTVEQARNWAAARGDTLVLVTADHSHSISAYGGYDLSKGPGQRSAVGVYEKAGFPDYYKNLDANGIPLVQNKATRGLAVGFAAVPDYCENYIGSGPVTQSPTVSDGKGGFVPNPEICKTGVQRTGNLDPASSQGVHTSDPFPLFAYGPGSQNFMGPMDQTELFFSMAKALGLNPASEARKK
ncbi:MAG: alkaline phosphatase [Pseudopedobacter sp.]|nr:alkaline phosphatase [Deinococcales bacterium]